MRIFEVIRPGDRRRLALGLGILAPMLYWSAAWHAPASVARPAAARSSPPGARTPVGKHSTGKVHFDLLAKLLADDRRARGLESPPCELPAAGSTTSADSPPGSPPHPLLGAGAPDFTLSDHRGRPWNLREQLARGPVVLVFYLGYECDACVHHLFELNADAERFRRAGARIVAVSGDGPAFTRGRFEQYGAFVFPVLSDPDRAVARSYEAMGPPDASRRVNPLHATFIVASDGRIAWAYRGGSPWRDSRPLLRALVDLKSNAAADTARAAETNSAETP